MSQIYNVPIISQDLRQEDTVIQIIDCLQYLDQCMNNMLQKIETKVNEKSKELQIIQQRTNIIMGKVDKLRGSKKATKVIANAKYPAMDSYKDYDSIFKQHEPISIQRQEYHLKSRFPSVEKKVLQEKLQFYHVKSSSKLLRRNVEISHEEGLGSLPHNVNSITSLLLFNTSENPYKQYKMLDPLGAVRKTKQVTDDEDEVFKMEAAPLSISQKEQFKKPIGENYFYSPDLGDVPQLDVPLNIPDLPGIADDLQYSMDSGPMIAPSVSTLFGTPEVLQEPPAPSTLQSLFSDQMLPPTETPEVKTVAPVPASLSTLASAPVSKQPQVTPAPPPPPPLPPPAPVEIETKDTPAKTARVTSPKAKPAGGDVRANLMEAIRQAGGTGKAKLRSASEKKTEAKKKKQELKASSSSGGDLMADLHAKLSLRRKGISGANKSGEPVASAMEKISAMIPPPPRPETSQISAADDESDWEA